MLVARILVTSSTNVTDVIVNERARHLGPGAPVREAITRAARGAELHVSRDLGDLERIARTIAARGSRGVVLAGGDGSYMAGATALADAFGAFGGAPPPIALAPGGTVSTIARAWGFAGSMESYAQKLVTAVIAGEAKATQRPSLLVRDATGARRVGFIFGTGLVASFFEVYEAQPTKGNAVAAKLVAAIFAGSAIGGALATRVLTPTPCTLRVGSAVKEPLAFSLIAASVLRDLGLHMRLTYRAPETSDRIHVVASALPPSALGPQMFRVLAGKPLRGAHHVDELTTEVEVRFTSDKRAYVLDGDLFEADLVHVTPGPQLTLLTP